MHLAYDLLEGYAALLLIDARPGSGAAGDLVSWRSARMMWLVGSSMLTGWIRSLSWPRCQTLAGSSRRPIRWAADRPSLARIGRRRRQSSVPAAADAVRRLVRQLIDDPHNVGERV